MTHLVFSLVLLVPPMAPKRVLDRPAMGVAERRQIERQLVQHGTSKTALVSTLESLEEAGLLDTIVESARTKRRSVQLAAEEHSKRDTVYGPVVQKMQIGVKGHEFIEYAHPMALLSVLCSLSSAFFGIMRSSVDLVARIVIYVDECTPGNVLRHDLGRQVQCVYWALCDWPSWMLQRTAAWPVFAIVRSSIINEMPGGLTAFMGKVLHTFFAEAGKSFARGIMLCNGTDAFMFKAVFGGFLADLAAHKYVYCTKGSSGRRFCPTCANVMRGVSVKAANDNGMCHISECDYRKLEFHTNDSFYECIDRLQRESGRMPKQQFEKLQTNIGYTYNSLCLFYDKHLRTIVSPLDNHLRDWMHVLCSNGLACTEIAFVMHNLMAVGITLDVLKEYACDYTLPRAHGTVKDMWFDDSHLKADTIQAFASEVLVMVPLIYAFLIDVVAKIKDCPLLKHIECFGYLNSIIGLLRQGPENAMKYVKTLRELVARHHAIYSEIYPLNAIKPKYHALLHLADDMEWLGCLLSCFVTERKHRATKRATLNVYRNLEHTVLATLINQQVEALPVFTRRSFLIDGHEIDIAGHNVLTSLHGAPACGETYNDDIVVISSRIVGKVVPGGGRRTLVQVEVLTKVRGTTNVFSVLSPRATFASVHAISQVVAWKFASDTQIRIITPFIWMG